MVIGCGTILIYSPLEVFPIQQTGGCQKALHVPLHRPHRSNRRKRGKQLRRLSFYQSSGTYYKCASGSLIPKSINSCKTVCFDRSSLAFLVLAHLKQTGFALFIFSESMNVSLKWHLEQIVRLPFMLARKSECEQSG
jgi:hypothetical protein